MSEQDPLKRDDKGRLVKGTPPGPGRTPGSISIKDGIRKVLTDNPEKLEELIEFYMKEEASSEEKLPEGQETLSESETSEEKPEEVEVEKPGETKDELPDY